ncbi:MAG TPA: efflux transporter outer membrane subunit [Candidatus Sulfopaludibacter sp.]|jgi:multidrug efflux system outer membrane protein|nr:efflux transporter outer membrane subunit [Candidatus Sulfopaludibacter sp.]
MRPLIPVAAILALSACTVGPKYRRPAIDVPPTYRNAEAGAVKTSIGDEQWSEVFQDAELQKLIRTALDRNYDVRIAASRILQAQAQVGITRSQQFPTVGAQAGVTGQKIPTFTFVLAELEGVFSWNIDFWGAYRNATEASRDTLLASEWNRKLVLSTVVANVASAYFALRELDLELDIAQKTLASRQESLKLTQTLEGGGRAGMLDVRQAEQLVETAAETIPDTQRQIAIQEDLISTLMGENPHAIPRGLPITGQPLPPEVPAGLPSQLIERRPDIRAAEAQLMAANAQIGVARAQFFPSLPLTGAGGLASAHLGQLFTGAANAWSFTAVAAQPIFNGGRLRSNLRLSESQEQEMLLTYQNTIQQAFRQVADTLASYGKYRDFREHQERLTTAAEDAARLSEMRYQGGATSYLEVLTSETNYFAAQLNLARARLNERLSLVQLYNALGGGWQQP